MVKIVGLLDGAVVDTININEDEDVTGVGSVTNRKVNSVNVIPGASFVSFKRIGRDSTRIRFDTVCETLAVADKLRKILNNVNDYDEVRLYLNSDTRFFRLKPETETTDYVGGQGLGYTPITIDAIVSEVFEMGAEHDETFELDLTFDGTDYGPDDQDNTIVWIPAMGTGNSTPDASGNGNYGTVYGTILKDTSFGLGRTLNGSTDYIALPSTLASADIISDTAGSIGFSLAIPDITPAAEQYILNVGDTDDNEVLEITITTAGKIRVTLIDGGSEDWRFTTDSAVFAIANRPYEIWLVQNATAPVLYVDGVAVDITFNTDTDKTEWFSALAGIDNYNIGRKNFNSATGNYLAGDLAWWVHMDNALTSAEVSAKAEDNDVLFSMANAGNVPASPTKYVITGATETGLIDQAQTDGDADKEFGQVGPNVEETAQYFMPSKDNSTKIAIQLKKSGTPTDNVEMAIQENVIGVVNPIMEDDFTDGDYTNNPTWTVKAGTWSAASNYLASTTLNGKISTPTTVSADADDRFEFNATLRPGDVGAGNGGIYPFILNQDDLDGNEDGYMLQFLEGGQTLFRRVDNGALTTLISTGFTPTAGQDVDIKITRDDTGEWEVFIDTVSKGTQVDNNHAPSTLDYLLIQHTIQAAHNQRADDISIKEGAVNKEGEPDGTDLLSATVVAGGSLTTNYVTYPVDLPFIPTLGTKYWAVLRRSGAKSDVNYYNVYYESGDDNYAEGGMQEYDGSDWANTFINYDFWFETFYAEHTKNPALYGEDDTETVLQLGKESIDQSYLIDDGTEPLILNAANDWLGFTFQPDKTKISKIKVLGDITGSAVGNCRVRLYEYDTTNDEPTGSALATSYLSPQEASTSKTDLFVSLEHGIDDGNSLDTSKTYIAVFDDAQGDASNYWTFYAQTTSGLDDTDTGRVVSSTDGGSTWTESVTVRGVIVTYYPDTISCKLLGDTAVTINPNDDTGTYQAVLTGDETVFGTYSTSGTITYDGTQIQMKADNDEIIYAFKSPYPMKNITLDYTVNPANNGVEIWVSTDNSTWELINHVESGEADDNVNQTPDLSSDYDEIAVLYVKFQSEGSTDATITRVGINTADLDTDSARRIAIKPATDTMKQSHDEISSGRAKIQVVYNDTYSS